MSTELDNQEAVATKHSLQTPWTFFFDLATGKTNDANWAESLKKILTFQTVEDFWGLYNNVLKATQLQHGSNYHLFREGIQPMWEDPKNAKGGKWVIQLKKQSSDLDKNWLMVMLACIGELLSDKPDLVCGVVLSVRKGQDRIALWLSIKEEEACKEIALAFKKIACLPNVTIGFQAHENAHSHSGKPSDIFTIPGDEQ